MNEQVIECLSANQESTQGKKYHDRLVPQAGGKIKRLHRQVDGFDLRIALKNERPQVRTHYEKCSETANHIEMIQTRGA